MLFAVHSFCSLLLRPKCRVDRLDPHFCAHGSRHGIRAPISTGTGSHHRARRWPRGLCGRGPAL
eukprot:2758350-Prymnesium_polylepis.2